MSDLRKQFNKELRKAKTPAQTHRIYTKYSDVLLARYGTILLCNSTDYVRTVCKILKSDKYRHDDRGLIRFKLTKGSAKRLMNTLEVYGNKLIK